MTFVRALLLAAISVTLLVWGSLQEQRVAIECMSAGHKWRPQEFPALTGSCVPGKGSARIFLPPLQLDTMPNLVDPTPEPVPEL